MNVLILGAAGSLAKVATRYLLENTDAHLTLFLRNANRLIVENSHRITVVEGDVFESEGLKLAMQGKNIVYANLAGDLKKQAENIVSAMKDAKIERLIFISSMGIYNEVPDEVYGNELSSYRESAEVVENSGLKYTLIRPGWFTNNEDINYNLTFKGEVFKGSSVSRLSISDLISRIVLNPYLFVYESLGISQVTK